MNPTIESLLERVAQLEAGEPTKVVVKDIDISKPVIVPYRHLEFPKMVYHHGKRDTKVVNSEEELKALPAEWDTKAFLPDNQLSEGDRLKLLSKKELIQLAAEEFDLEYRLADKKEAMIEGIMKAKGL